MRSKSGRIRIIVGIMIIFFITGSYIISIHTSDAMESLPRVSVALARVQYYAQVHPDMNGSIEINGTVRVEGSWPVGYSEITATISADAGGWEMDLPDSIELTSERSSKNFTLILHVPKETSHSTEATIEVGGKWVSVSKDKSGLIFSSTANIRIKQYYKFSLSSEEKTGSVKLGEELGFRCRLINEGNGNDRIRLEIVNQKNLTENGILVVLSQDKFQVPEKQEKILTVTINASASVAPGNYSIRIRALSAQAEGLDEVGDISELELFINVQSKDVSMDEVPFPEIGHIIMLITISVLFYINNKRNGREYSR